MPDRDQSLAQPVAMYDSWIWDRNEALERGPLQELQLQRLQRTVERVLAAQPPGAEKLRRAGIESAQDIRELSDLAKLPFMVKQDLRDGYPFGLMTVPRAELARLHASSGTNGRATIVGYTRGDVENWSELMARCMAMAGVRPGMLVHNANGYGLFTGGFGFQHGAERLGATVVPVGAGFSGRQAALIADLEAEVLISTPSYALAIAAAMREAGIDPSAVKLRLGLFGGEHATRRMRDEIERELGLISIINYGLSEMCGPGVACECLHERDGLHVQEDHFILEVLEPDGERVLDPGEEGELVFTTLTKEAMPLIRYRTGDLGRMTLDPCPCGRTSARVTIGGRRDDMVTVRGINVFPSTVEHLLLGVPGIGPNYRLVVERPGPLDELTLECEAYGDVDRDSLGLHVQRLVREHMGIRVTVVVHPSETLPRSEGKAVRVIDRRRGSAA